jgi:hypothetical protein
MEKGYARQADYRRCGLGAVWRGVSRGRAAGRKGHGFLGLKYLGLASAGAVSPFLRHFFLYLSLQPCNNPIEIQFKPLRLFPWENAGMR